MLEIEKALKESAIEANYKAQEKENITEPMEADRIAQIEQVYKKSFQNDT